MRSFVIKTNDIIFQKDRDPYVSPLYYTKALVVGFVSVDNAEPGLREEPAIMGVIIEAVRGIVLLMI